ncbi:MAG: hypothetical protein JNM57_15760 [Cyclobacteriaceae bacterium]|nr:hypothetical protein [Cyclobacteriaceae bacterium]
MTKTKKHNLTIAFGIFTALVVVFSQLFLFESSGFQKKEVKTEKQEEKNGGDVAYISQPSSSLPTSTTVLSTYDSFCVLEILFESETESDHASNKSLFPEKLFFTLFRFIISPNAP